MQYNKIQKIQRFNVFLDKTIHSIMTNDYEDLIADIPKHGKKELAKNLIIPIFPMILPFIILGLLTLVDVKPFVNEHIPNYKTYFEFLPTAVQIIMGGIVVISIFYLGKIHDYRKDLIIHNAKFLLLLKNEQDEKKKETIGSFQLIFKDMLNVHNSSKKLIIYAMIVMLMIFSVLLIYSLSTEEPNEDRFVTLLSLFIILIVIFLSYWYFFEYMLNFSENILNLILKVQYKYGSE